MFAAPVHDLDWDSESKKIVVAGEGSGLVVKCITWDTGNSVGEMSGHNKRVLSVAYRPTRPFRVMSGGEDMRCIFYAGPPFKFSHSNSTHTNFVNCVRYSPDGSKVVSVSTDKTIQLYDGATGQPTAELTNAHAGGIYSASFSPDSASFATASADKTVKIWDAATLALLQTLPIAADPQLGDAQVAVLWTRTHLLSVSLNGNINILDRGSPDGPVRTICAHQVGVSALFVEPAPQLLFTGSCDGVICRRSLADGGNSAVKLAATDKRSMEGGVHSTKVVGIVARPGDDLVLSSGWDDKLRLAGADVALNGQPCSLVASKDTELVLSVTNAEIALFRGLDKVASLGALSYTPTCGSLLGETEVAVGGSDNKTHIYSISGLAFSEVASIQTRSAVASVAYCPTGDLLAVGDAGRQVEVFERGSWQARVKGEWVFHTSRITALAWSPSGASLASGSLDENVFVWSLARPQSKIQMAYAHTGGVTALAWANEETLVSVGNDNATVVWTVPAEWAQ